LLIEFWLCFFVGLKEVTCSIDRAQRQVTGLLSSGLNLYTYYSVYSWTFRCPYEFWKCCHCSFCGMHCHSQHQLHFDPWKCLFTNSKRLCFYSSKLRSVVIILLCCMGL
jgi:hypothetical protein